MPDALGELAALMKYTQLSIVVYLNEVEELWEKKHGISY
jgi:hypothetical protein